MFIDADTSSRPARDSSGWRARFGRSEALLLVLPVWLSAFALFRPLAEPDEGRYTHIARAMTQTGDWLIPRIDGLPFLHKPPLYYWLEALCIEAFGMHLWTARLPSLLAAIVICGCTYALALRHVGERAARWTVAVLATSPLFFAGAQFANLDMLVTAFITLALTLAVCAAEAPQREARLLFFVAYVAAALGVLTKGLIGAVLPAAIFTLWAISIGNPRLVRQAISVPGLIAFFAITVPWFWAVETRIPGFLHHFFIYHHLERFLTQEFNGQYGAWFYPLIAGAGLLPWTLLLIGPLRNRIVTATLPRNLGVLGLVWFGFVMVFYSFPASKMIGYIFPVLPAFAIVIGPALAGWRWREPALAASALICLGFGVAGPGWQKYTPIGPISAVSAGIAPADDLVFMDHFSYDALVRLDRPRAAYFYGDWSKHSSQMPDSLRRQFVEGAEFEHAGGKVLIDEAGLAKLIRERRGAVWVVADKLSHYPALVGLPVMAEDARVQVLRVDAPEGDKSGQAQ